MLSALADWLQPWSDLYNSSVAMETVVLAGHLGGLLVAGGFAVATDRMILRVRRASGAIQLHTLRELGRIHRPVLVGLVAVILTGIAMLLADVQTFLPSWVFWLKMALFVALLVNGWVLEREGRRLERVTEGDADAEETGAEWTPLRRASIRSASLWGATLLFGVLLTAV